MHTRPHAGPRSGLPDILVSEMMRMFKAGAAGVKAGPPVAASKMRTCPKV